MRPRIKVDGLAEMREVKVGGGTPDVSRSYVGAEAGQEVCDRLGIARRAEERLNASGVERREEIAEIHTQHCVVAGMWTRESFYGTVGDKAVSRGVRWDVLQDSREDGALELLEADLRTFDEAEPTRGFCQKSVVVVAQTRGVGLALEALEIGVPVELGEVDRQPVGEVMDGLNGGDVPAGSGRSGLHLRGLAEPMFNGEFAMVTEPSALQADVIFQKFDDSAMARA